MAYTKTSWQDHVVDTNTGKVIQQGTPVSAKNMNNIEQGITYVHEQLEVGKSQTAKLMQGANIINTDIPGQVDLNIGGSSETNLLGDYGTIKDSNGDGLADGWTKNTGTIPSISGEYQRITSASSDTGMSRFVTYPSPSLVIGKKYLVISEAQSDGVAPLEFGLYDRNDAGNLWQVVTAPAGTTSAVMYKKFEVTKNVVTPTVIAYNKIALGSVGWTQYKNIGVYEITDDALWNAIGTTITESNIRDYFPHVDGRKPVQGVLVTKIGRNILPGIPMNINSSATANGNYDLTLNATTLNLNSNITVDVIPGRSYVFQCTGTGQTAIFAYSSAGVGTQLKSSNDTTPYKFTVPAGVFQVRVYFSNYGTANGLFTWKDWKLELGETATPFEPREDQRVLIPVTLGEVGGVRDSVDVRGAEATLTKRLERGVVIDGISSTLANTGSLAGYKAFTLDSKIINKANGYDRNTYSAIKYNGASLISAANTAAVDSIIVYDMSSGYAGKIVLTISNSDSGFSDAYNPVSTEVHALLNGWKAKTVDANGKPTAWQSILSGADAPTQTLAYVSTNKAPNWTGYATLDYLLATPDIKKVTGAEVGISLHQGGNLITIETGIILREKANPVKSSGVYFINADLLPESRLKNKAKKILTVYKGLDVETKWKNGTSGGYGDLTANIQISESDYDPAAEYFVTYLVLDKYAMSTNVLNATANYNTSPKSVQDRTVANVAELQAKTSILTRSVAEMYKKLKALGG